MSIALARIHSDDDESVQKGTHRSAIRKREEETSVYSSRFEEFQQRYQTSSHTLAGRPREPYPANRSLSRPAQAIEYVSHFRDQDSSPLPAQQGSDELEGMFWGGSSFTIASMERNATHSRASSMYEQLLIERSPSALSNGPQEDLDDEHVTLKSRGSSRSPPLCSADVDEKDACRSRTYSGDGDIVLPRGLTPSGDRYVFDLSANSEYQIADNSPAISRRSSTPSRPSALKRTTDQSAYSEYRPTNEYRQSDSSPANSRRSSAATRPSGINPYMQHDYANIQESSGRSLAATKPSGDTILQQESPMGVRRASTVPKYSGFRNAPQETERARSLQEDSSSASSSRRLWVPNRPSALSYVPQESAKQQQYRESSRRSSTSTRPAEQIHRDEESSAISGRYSMATEAPESLFEPQEPTKQRYHVDDTSPPISLRSSALTTTTVIFRPRVSSENKYRAEHVISPSSLPRPSVNRRPTVSFEHESTKAH
ncbi:hypothetical protein BJ742DRAFT_775566 [Cladochytrium replicatum]|nr:hypothetical protein BJ742DRAFT_775566 [Cladochytrium replicatum]